MFSICIASFTGSMSCPIGPIRLGIFFERRCGKLGTSLRRNLRQRSLDQHHGFGDVFAFKKKSSFNSIFLAFGFNRIHAFAFGYHFWWSTDWTNNYQRKLGSKIFINLKKEIIGKLSQISHQFSFLLLEDFWNYQFDRSWRSKDPDSNPDSNPDSDPDSNPDHDSDPERAWIKNEI